MAGAPPGAVGTTPVRPYPQGNSGGDARSPSPGPATVPAENRAAPEQSASPTPSAGNSAIENRLTTLENQLSRIANVLEDLLEENPDEEFEEDDEELMGDETSNSELDSDNETDSGMSDGDLGRIGPPRRDRRVPARQLPHSRNDSSRDPGIRRQLDVLIRDYNRKKDLFAKSEASYKIDHMMHGIKLLESLVREGPLWPVNMPQKNAAAQLEFQDAAETLEPVLEEYLSDHAEPSDEDYAMLNTLLDEVHQVIEMKSTTTGNALLDYLQRFKQIDQEHQEVARRRQNATPSAPPPARSPAARELGVQLADRPGQTGPVVTSVVAGSPATRMVDSSGTTWRLEPGDAIRSINGRPTPNRQAVLEAVEASGPALTLEAIGGRDGRVYKFTIQIGPK
jgi:hypothetical protein